jgi:hypothetical protein
VFATANSCGRSVEKLIDLHMPRTHAERRYLIEIKDSEGSIVFRAGTTWDDKDKRIALAQITCLARLPEVNFYAEPALVPQSGNSDRRPRPGPRRHSRESR